MRTDSTARRTCALVEAQQMLTRVRVLTEQAMQEVDQLSSALHRMEETDPGAGRHGHRARPRGGRLDGTGAEDGPRDQGLGAGGLRQR